MLISLSGRLQQGDRIEQQEMKKIAKKSQPQPGTDVLSLLMSARDVCAREKSAVGTQEKARSVRGK
jgi:cytochrome P450